jgi:hypothetical protein
MSSPSRRYRDAHGIELELAELRWRDVYVGLEGGAGPAVVAELVLKHRLPELLKQWPRVPHLVFGDRDRDAEGWLPPELVIARLTSNWRPSGAEGVGSTHLVVVWFSGTHDPFSRLAELLSTIDWAAVAMDRRWD